MSISGGSHPAVFLVLIGDEYDGTNVWNQNPKVADRSWNNTEENGRSDGSLPAGGMQMGKGPLLPRHHVAAETLPDPESISGHIVRAGDGENI
jgi:hypothetical protein